MAKKNKKQEELIDETITTEVTEQATEAIIKAIKVETLEETEVIYPKPNHFPDCNCFKCIRWRNQNA